MCANTEDFNTTGNSILIETCTTIFSVNAHKVLYEMALDILHKMLENNIEKKNNEWNSTLA